MDFRIIGEERISQCPIRSTSPSHYYRHGGCGCFEFGEIVKPAEVDADGTIITGHHRITAAQIMALRDVEGAPGPTRRELIHAEARWLASDCTASQ